MELASPESVGRYAAERALARLGGRKNRHSRGAGAVREHPRRGPALGLRAGDQRRIALPPAWTDAQGRRWLRTGDVGRLDEEGFLYIVDRKKDLILSGGQNIYPADIEMAALEHPDVAEVAVIGVPSERWGETPLAVVVPRAGAETDAAALEAWINAHVGRQQRVTGVVLRDSLPRNPNGKIPKRELRVEYAAGWSGQTEHDLNGTGWHDCYFESPDGLMLYYREYPAESSDRLPVMCLPGLTRNAKDFETIAPRLYKAARYSDSLASKAVVRSWFYRLAPASCTRKLEKY